MADLTLIGNACVDIYVPQHAPPPPGGITFLDGPVEFHVGGNAANTSIVASRLGCKVELLGCLGDDPVGDIVRGRLQDAGVDVSRLRIAKDQSSPTTIVVNDASGERSFVHHAGTNRSWDRVPDATLSESQVLLFAGVELIDAIWPETAVQLAKSFRELDGDRRVGLDPFVDFKQEPASLLELHREFLSHVDMVFPNEPEALALTNTQSIDAAIDRFHELGVSIVIVKRGEHGARLSHKGQCHEITASSVPVVDTCGAGDNFVAGFVSAFIAGLPLEQCVRRGCAMGTLCVQYQGAVTGSENSERTSAALSSVSVDPST